MTETATSVAPSTAVSPLELFFDLVFVFAVARLSEHVLEHLTWRGVAEAAVMLVGVFLVWAYTSFDATLTSVRRSSTQRMLVGVMAVAFFMNVGISRAFEERPWDFVGPMLAVQFGRTLIWTVPAAGGALRGHYARAMAWWTAALPLWVVGALSDPDARLAWWSGAVLIELLGLWLAHPLPGHWLRSETMPFDAEHMIERLRLFLIIALGEVVLATGVALASTPGDWMARALGACALLVVIALWAVFFGASDHWVSRHLATTQDPMRSARLGIFTECVGVAGLVSIAVANESAIVHPHAPMTGLLALLMFGGVLLYLTADAWYLKIVTGVWSRLRLGFLGVLLFTALVAQTVETGTALMVLTAELVLFVVALRRTHPRA